MDVGSADLVWNIDRPTYEVRGQSLQALVRRRWRGVPRVTFEARRCVIADWL
jgi:hypothetical protein